MDFLFVFCLYDTREQHLALSEGFTCFIILLLSATRNKDVLHSCFMLQFQPSKAAVGRS